MQEASRKVILSSRFVIWDTNKSVKKEACQCTVLHKTNKPQLNKTWKGTMLSKFTIKNWNRGFSFSHSFFDWHRQLEGGCLKVTLPPGDIFAMPAQFLHFVLTRSDTVAMGYSFLAEEHSNEIWKAIAEAIARQLSWPTVWNFKTSWKGWQFFSLNQQSLVLSLRLSWL